MKEGTKMFPEFGMNISGVGMNWGRKLKGGDCIDRDCPYCGAYRVGPVCYMKFIF